MSAMQDKIQRIHYWMVSVALARCSRVLGNWFPDIFFTYIKYFFNVDVKIQFKQRTCTCIMIQCFHLNCNLKFTCEGSELSAVTKESGLLAMCHLAMPVYWNLMVHENVSKNSVIILQCLNFKFCFLELLFPEMPT